MKRIWLKNACEEIDAEVFSGDMLLDDEDRNEFKEYLERWKRAIFEYELKENEIKN